MPSLNLHAGNAARRLTDRVCPNCGRADLMTIAEWRERIGLSTTSAWRMMKAGDGPRLTEVSGRRPRIREKDFVAWLNSRPVRTTTKPYRK